MLTRAFIGETKDMSKKEDQFKPVPIVESRVCSVCQLDWEEHLKLMNTGDQEPTVLDCVELLKRKLAVKSLTRLSNQTTVQPNYFDRIMGNNAQAQISYLNRGIV
jgi:hypothetical protein